jgi:iron complex outermembrane receptor protein
MALLETATLVRGAAAARFGPGAMAGALDFGLSKRREERLFVELLGGSFGSIRGLVGGTGEAGPGHLRAWVQAMHSDGSFRFRFDPTPNLPRDTFVSRRRHNNDADKVDTLLHYTLPLGRWQTEAWTHLGFHQRGLAGAVENPSPSLRQSGDTFRALLRAQGPLGESPFTLKLSAATQLGHMLLQGGSFGEGLRQRDNSADFNADLGWTHGPYLAFAQGSFRYERLKSSEASRVGKAERWALGGMLGGEAWLLPERWALNGLARVDKAGHFASPSAKAGSLWLLPRGFGLSANAGRSFRIPSFFELYMEQGQVRPNPDLLAESAWAFDVGLLWEGEKARAAAGYFWSRFENLVVWEYFPPFALKPFNLGKAQTHGVEVEASWGPWPWLHLEGAYTWLHTQNLQGDLRYAKKPLPYRPRHQLFARAEVGPRQLSAFVEWHFQSSQTRNSFANLSWPSRSLLNAGLKSQWLHNPTLSLGLTFKNLLDTHSQDMAGYPLPPRAVFLSLSLEWAVAPRLAAIQPKPRLCLNHAPTTPSPLTKASPPLSGDKRRHNRQETTSPPSEAVSSYGKTIPQHCTRVS